MQISRKTIQVAGRPVHYLLAGQGEPVVLIHGLAESTEVWRRNLHTLAARYQVYLLDLPGFGAMRKFHVQFDLQESPRWLAAWMDALGLESATLIGHSMGGYPSMALSALHPEKVRRLVLVDSIGIPFGDLARCQLYLALKSIIRTTPAFWPCITYDILRSGPVMVGRAARQIHLLDASPVITAVTAPTLLVWGEHDDLVPLRFGYQLHELLVGSRLAIIPRANHFCMFERPAEFHNLLLPFLEEQPADRANYAQVQKGEKQE